jgi:hypothetical protein
LEAVRGAHSAGELAKGEFASIEGVSGALFTGNDKCWFGSGGTPFKEQHEKLTQRFHPMPHQ